MKCRKGKAFPHIRRQSRKSLIRISSGPTTASSATTLTRSCLVILARLILTSLPATLTGLSFCLYFRAGNQTQLAVGHDLLTRLQSFFDYSHVVEVCASLDGAHLDGVVELDDINERFILTCLDCL